MKRWFRKLFCKSTPTGTEADTSSPTATCETPALSTAENQVFLVLQQPDAKYALVIGEQLKPTRGDVERLRRGGYMFAMDGECHVDVAISFRPFPRTRNGVNAVIDDFRMVFPRITCRGTVVSMVELFGETTSSEPALRKSSGTPLDLSQRAIAAQVESTIPAAAADAMASPSLRGQERTRNVKAELGGEWKVGDIVLGRYEVKEIFKGGGMGLVYRVHERGSNIDLAVKRPRSDFFRTKAHMRNLVRELEIWIKLGKHPHVVECHYLRADQGIPLIFAEYVEGRSLKDWIDSGKLYEGGPQVALARILDIAIQTAWGLNYAHRHGVIHQDVKPGNVLVELDGTAKISDFGLARARVVDGEWIDSGELSGISTNTGGMTAAYCSPEQANRRPLTLKTDIWSWGVTLLEMFAGEAFWKSGVAAAEILEMLPECQKARCELPQMPDSLRSLLARCFAPAPDERPASMVHLANSIIGIYQTICNRDYPRIQPLDSEAIRSKSGPPSTFVAPNTPGPIFAILNALENYCDHLPSANGECTFEHFEEANRLAGNPLSPSRLRLCWERCGGTTEDRALLIEKLKASAQNPYSADETRSLFELAQAAGLVGECWNCGARFSATMAEPDANSICQQCQLPLVRSGEHGEAGTNETPYRLFQKAINAVRVEDKIALLKKALESCPSHQRSLKEMGIILQDHCRDYEAAVPYLIRAADCATDALDDKSVVDFKARMWDRAAACCEKIGRYEDAIALWDRALAEGTWSANAAHQIQRDRDAACARARGEIPPLRHCGRSGQGPEGLSRVLSSGEQRILAECARDGRSHDEIVSLVRSWNFSDADAENIASDLAACVKRLPKH